MATLGFLCPKSNSCSSGSGDFLSSIFMWVFVGVVLLASIYIYKPEFFKPKEGDDDFGKCDVSFSKVMMTFGCIVAIMLLLWFLGFGCSKGC